ncbi:MAG: hypothetical protein RBU30_18150 [Polyangia bacterium]|jgi:hypothetical protein|nr:hypothetical protein [Polyangia bacterium]
MSPALTILRPPGRGSAMGLGLIALLALFTLGACPRSHGPRGEQPSHKNRIRPGHAPTPFTAEEIRKACPSGHFRRYLVEVPGKPPIFRILTFRDVNKESADFTSAQVDGRGRPFGEQRRLRARWKAFQAHASFPKADTTIRKATVATAGGIFETWLYEVTSRGSGERERYWFAPALPGPPVQYERHEDGSLLFRMTLVQHGQSRPDQEGEPATGPATGSAQGPTPGPAQGPATGSAQGPAPGPAPAEPAPGPAPAGPAPGPAPPAKKNPIPNP